MNICTIAAFDTQEIFMGLRFQKRLPLMKGLRLNLSKGGASFSIGKKGASINVGPNGIYGNAGVPGSGISYREKLSNRSGRGLGGAIFWLLALAVLGYFIGGNSLQDVINNVLATTHK